MMIHKDLTSEDWFKYSLFKQLSNVGTEVSRAIRWKNKGKPDLSKKAFYRALELLYLTIDDPKNRGACLKELTRAYEMLGDYFAGENEYNSSDDLWEKYFLTYNYAARVKALA